MSESGSSSFHPASPGLRWIIVILLGAGVIPPGSSAAKSGATFHFSRYIGLERGSRFSIVIKHPAGNRIIGSGRILSRDAGNLEFQFEAAGNGMRIIGRVRLQYLGENRRDLLFRLRYRGHRGGQNENSVEKVNVPGYLAGAGILTFRYGNQGHFFQLSRNSRGENKLVTDWGVATLIPSVAGRDSDGSDR